jgi:hypothetical protein
MDSSDSHVGRWSSMNTGVGLPENRIDVIVSITTLFTVSWIWPWLRNIWLDELGLTNGSRSVAILIFSGEDNLWRGGNVIKIMQIIQIYILWMERMVQDWDTLNDWQIPLREIYPISGIAFTRCLTTATILYSPLQVLYDTTSFQFARRSSSKMVL